MATPEQIAANRLNAKKSTGPRTEAGKASVRLNAFKHGIFAEAHILIGEDKAALEALSDDYFQRYQPAAPEEETLVANLVNHSWFLVRFRKLESLTWNMRLEDPISRYPMVSAHIYAHKELEFLQRRINSVHRQFHRDLAVLTQLQAARQVGSDPAPGPDLPAVSPSGPAPQPQSPEPPEPEIGFVPANEIGLVPLARDSAAPKPENAAQAPLRALSLDPVLRAPVDLVRNFLTTHLKRVWTALRGSVHQPGLISPI